MVKPKPAFPLPVLIIGDAFVDIFCQCSDGMPVLGGDTLLQAPIQILAGGSGVNTATHLASLLRQRYLTCEDEDSNHVQLYTALGDDSYGVLLRDHAKKYGFEVMNCALVTDDKANGATVTGHCIVIVANKDRSFLTYRGCIEHYNCDSLSNRIFQNVPSLLEQERQHIQQQHIHVAGYYNIPNFWHGKLTQQLLLVKEQKKTEKIRTTISLVPQYDASGEWDGGILDVIKQCGIDFLIMSEPEALAISKSTSFENVATFLKSNLPQTFAIVTMGDKGAVVLYNGEKIMTQSVGTVNVIDSTGAGDAFAAGFIDGFLIALFENLFKSSDVTQEGDNNYDNAFLRGIKEGLKRGCAVGTANVMTVGASKPSTRSLIEHCFDAQT